MYISTQLSIMLTSYVCVCVCDLLSRVRLFGTPWTAAHQAPLFMGILEARVLEWVVTPFCRSSSRPRDQTQVSHIVGRFFIVRATREAQYLT